jgi:hypothetical protein
MFFNTSMAIMNEVSEKFAERDFHGPEKPSTYVRVGNDPCSVISARVFR